MKVFGAIILILYQVISYTLSQKCPEGCRCMWKSGKKAVDCIDSNLFGIPRDIQPGTQILDLTGNFIRVLPSKLFLKMGMINLQKLYLPRCAIAEIADDAFNQVANLIEMDLSSNFLPCVPTPIFRDTPILRRLQLSHNPIQRLENNSFEGLSYLTTLELSNCKIQSVEIDAFRGLQRLEYLKLDGNRLEIITKDVIRDLPPLYALDLHRNSWTCDCRVGEVRLWMVEHNVPFSDPPRCERPPRLRGLFWDVLEVNDLACPPEAKSIESEIIVTERKDVVLKCKIYASPEGIVRWIWRGRSIANLSLMSFGRQMYLIREIGNTEKTTQLTIFNVMLKDSGKYTCFSSNPAGNASAEITLTVLPLVLQTTGLSSGEICAIVFGSLVVVVLTVALFLVIFHHRLKFPTREEKLLILPKPVVDFFNSHHIPQFRKRKSDHKSNRIKESIKPITDALENATDDQIDSLSNTKDIKEITILRDEGEKQLTRTISSQSVEKFKKLNDNANEVKQNEHEHDHDDREQNEQQKHEVVVSIDQVHHSLSPEARDSPDEGLGDEREYETEVVD